MFQEHNPQIITTQLDKIGINIHSEICGLDQVHCSSCIIHNMPEEVIIRKSVGEHSVERVTLR